MDKHADKKKQRGNRTHEEILGTSEAGDVLGKISGRKAPREKREHNEPRVVNGYAYA